MLFILFGGVLLVAGYITLTAESVLIVDGCSSFDCHWKEVNCSVFRGNENLWERCQERGKYAVFNNTGKPPRTEPVFYNRFEFAGDSSESTFIIPAGVSVIDERPDYLMRESPDQISTRAHSGTVIRWELWCN